MHSQNPATSSLPGVSGTARKPSDWVRCDEGAAVLHKQYHRKAAKTPPTVLCLARPVPEELFSDAASLDHIFLNGNKLTGRLPSDLARLQRLEEFYVGDNMFTGPIPHSFPETLRTLSVMRNQLSGTVPVKALAQLPNLDVVHLNGNPDLRGEKNAVDGLRAGVVQRGVERGEYAQGLVYCARE